MEHDESSEAGDPPRGELPERRVTPNMLVAYNMGRWRQAAGLTQERLGELLGGWTKTAVSAAERSWDGKRVRQFDADLLANLARIFGVPLPAMFMPPPDDAETFRYAVAVAVDMDAGHGPISMSAFFAACTGAASDPFSGDSPAARAYQQALIAAAAKYRTHLGVEPRLRLLALGVEETLVGFLRHAKANRQKLAEFEDALPGVIEDNDIMQDILVRTLNEMGRDKGWQQQASPGDDDATAGDRRGEGGAP